ncbi:MAG: hypothetical protein HZB14_07640 [Actinobacteria bacterium]|nr:hypothetical protein [Actinomycetota bacterium]
MKEDALPRTPDDADDVALQANATGWVGRVKAVAAGISAGLLGAAPHVLHHVGPLAGAAVLAGATGKLIFGVVGFVAMIPLFRKLHRKSGGWRVPALALVAMSVIFLFSTLVIGPALTGGDDPAQPTTEDERKAHESHHD